MKLSVFIPTHNPHQERLRRTLEGLLRQTLPAAEWEILLVDNGSNPPVSLDGLVPAPAEASRIKILREPQLGLTSARRCGFKNSAGALIVMADDDNVLAPDYLEQVVKIFDDNPALGAAGGKSVPEFETSPPPWMNEFFGLLACRDLGDKVQIEPAFTGAAPRKYPHCAPIGAGMAIRREAAAAWLQHSQNTGLTDRKGKDLTSGGDNDIVLSILASGWSVGYFPALQLTHLIPAGRLDPEYLARLNCGIAKSWMWVLSRHQCNPWPPIPAWTAPFRKMKAWISFRAWSGPAERIRWNGACGHFEGRTRAASPGNGA